MISHTTLTGAKNPNAYLLATVIFFNLRSTQAYSGIIEMTVYNDDDTSLLMGSQFKPCRFSTCNGE